MNETVIPTSYCRSWLIELLVCGYVPYSIRRCTHASAVKLPSCSQHKVLFPFIREPQNIVSYTILLNTQFPPLGSLQFILTYYTVTLIFEFEYTEGLISCLVLKSPCEMNYFEVSNRTIPEQSSSFNTGSNKQDYSCELQVRQEQVQKLETFQQPLRCFPALLLMCQNTSRVSCLRGLVLDMLFLLLLLQK